MHGRLGEPHQVPHTTFNPGSEQSRIFQVLTPAGSEYFFIEVGALIRDGAWTEENLGEVANKHGIRYFDDWTEELKSTYNLRLLGE